jgi:hypothetical protein
MLKNRTAAQRARALAAPLLKCLITLHPYPVS